MTSSNISATGIAVMVVLVATVVAEMSRGAPTNMQKRLQKELKAMQRDPPPGVKVDYDKIIASNDMTKWIVHIEGPKGSLYAGEHFQLKFEFGPNYPFESPEVTFVGPNIPAHPHVYSNGHICFSLLTDDWSPAQSVESVCLSIVSMLSSAKSKWRPLENVLYVLLSSKSPKKSMSWYKYNFSV